MTTPRTVVITGGSKGMGRDIARAFHRNGDDVIVASRSDNGFAREFPERMHFAACDVRRPEDLHTLVRDSAQSGRIDVFINNSGYSEWQPLERIDEAFWDNMIATNLKGSFFGCQAAAAAMPSGGVIINVSSLASKRGTPNNAVYCASKFGLNGITQALAKELGPRGIRVNGVCPVLIATDGLMEALRRPEAPPAGGSVENWLANFAATQSALGRLPTGAEVADLCLFLASPAASAITGQNINVDCGVLPQ
ncbi:MAG TPA: SDR family oxidoreductase [Tepidisphaeraceae bacterium]|jgi:3-oxoacyl-[acyl-carrier protein] reductase/meso-butanediol dehydrogenase/(S,S)-butanediol dehydrogenase/diacetyl reductase|nr:SDR family oxidoreductase [Tepidisphaeraceae bacterium]